MCLASPCKRWLFPLARNTQLSVAYNSMKSKTRNTLIAGVALLIFGPVLGWVLTLAGFFKTEQSILQTPPGTFPDMGQAASHMFVSTQPRTGPKINNATPA